MAKKEKNCMEEENMQAMPCKGELAEDAFTARAMDEDLIEGATAFFKIFGDKTRLRILLALEGKELCVHTLSHILNVNQTTLSHQLKILRDFGLVCCRRADKHVFYQLKDDHIKAILDIATEHINE